MKQLLNIKAIFILIAFSVSNLNAQEFYFSLGLNLTTYDFEGTDNTPLNLNSKTGQFYELGYRLKMLDETLQYGVGLALNNFNTTGGDIANNYEWETTYIGINNTLEYAIISSSTSPFELLVGVQFQMMHIISGEQKINGALFDLTKETEFKGFWLQPGFLLTTKYYISDDWQLSLGYNNSIAFNTSNETQEKLKFKNHQLRFGLHFNIN